MSVVSAQLSHAFPNGSPGADVGAVPAQTWRGRKCLISGVVKSGSASGPIAPTFATMPAPATSGSPAGALTSACRASPSRGCGRVSEVPAQMWVGRAPPQCRCGRVNPVPVQMWADEWTPGALPKPACRASPLARMRAEAAARSSSGPVGVVDGPLGTLRTAPAFSVPLTVRFSALHTVFVALTTTFGALDTIFGTLNTTFGTPDAIFSNRRA
jgi:hypothetical protein